MTEDYRCPGWSGTEIPGAGRQGLSVPLLSTAPSAPVDFADPVNLVPLAGGIIAGIGNLAIKFTSTFSITGIAAGTLIVIIGYHAVRRFARRPLDESPTGGRAYEGTTSVVANDSVADPPEQRTDGTPRDAP